MKSKEILPDDKRISGEELKQMFMDINAPMKIQMYFINMYQALKTAELEILDYMSKLNSAHQELVVWQQDYKTLNDEYNQLKQTLTDYIEIHNTRFKDLCDKYAEISWNIESLAAKNQENNGISNGLFREMIRELLDKDANERYNKAIKWININVGYPIEDLKQALKIAAYGNI